MVEDGKSGLIHPQVSCILDRETDAWKAEMDCPRVRSRMLLLTPSLVLFSCQSHSKFQTFMKDLGFKFGRQAGEPHVSEGRWECFLYFSKREMSRDPLEIQDTSQAGLWHPVTMSPQCPVPFIRATEHPL